MFNLHGLKSLQSCWSVVLLWLNMKVKDAGRSVAAVLALLGAIVSLNIGSSYGKQLFSLVGAEGTTTFRVVFAALILLIAWRPWRMPLSQADRKAILLYGLVLGLMNLTFYLSLRYLPLGLAIAIEFIGPLSVALLSSRQPKDILWIFLAGCGIFLLLPLPGSASALSMIGVGFALASAFFWALYIVFGHRLGHLHEGQSTSLGMLVAAAVVLPFGISQAGRALLNGNLLLSGLFVATLSSAIPYSLEMFALKRLPKSTFGILCSLEPAVGAIAGMIVLHEQLTLLQWIAISLVMAASVGTSQGAAREVHGGAGDGVVN